jgi:hypothetical protein
VFGHRTVRSIESEHIDACEHELSNNGRAIAGRAQSSYDLCGASGAGHGISRIALWRRGVAAHLI